MKGKPAIHLSSLLAAFAAVTGVWAQDEQEDRDSDRLEVREVLEDTLDEHLPWWMPRASRSEPSSHRRGPSNSFYLQLEEDRGLSLGEVVAQIRRSYDGRVLAADETAEGFVVRLLLDGGRLRTLHVSPDGRVVREDIEGR